MNAIFQLLNPNNTVSVNRPLAHAIGLNEAVVYGTLVAKYYWYSEREMLDDGWFYSTAPDLQESTALSEKQQKRCVDNLVKAGLIRCELRGMPAKRSFYIVEDIDLLQSLLSDGETAMHKIKPAAAESYEKKRKSPAEPNENTRRMSDFLSAAFGGTAPSPVQSGNEPEDEIPHNSAVSPCSDKKAEQEPPKEETLLRQKGGASSDLSSEHYSNKTKSNKPNIINPSIPRAHEDKPALPVPADDMIDEIDMLEDERAYYTSIVRENTECDILIEQSRSSGRKDEAEKIEELVSVMVDVICSKKPTIRVNGEEFPHEVVKSVFLKLTESHIEYVLTALKKNTSKVHNIRSYLITALYNAPSTISSFYSAEVNHDLYGESEFSFSDLKKFQEVK